MQIDEALISKLEKLARLQLAPEERAQFAQDLTHILDMVDKLQQLDTKGVEPLTYLTDAVNVMRADEVAHQLAQADALFNGPKQDGQYFRVPKVIN